jgi:citrate synthase
MNPAELTARLEQALRTPLAQLVMEAHRKSALANPNASKQAVMLAAAGSYSIEGGIVAGIATLGGAHGPVLLARRAIYSTDEVNNLVLKRERVPGWGNSFYPHGDPAWVPVRNYLAEHHPGHIARLDNLTGVIGKRIQPNAAAYTAVAAEVLEMPYGTELLLFLMGRLPAWVALGRDAIVQERKR